MSSALKWFFVGMAIIALDQATKVMATIVWPEFRGDGELFSLGVVLNTSKNMFPAIVSLAYLLSTRLPSGPKCLVVAGGISNLLEVVFAEGVVDFIGVRVSQDSYMVLNLADVFIGLAFIWMVAFVCRHTIKMSDFIPGSVLCKE